MKTPWHQRGRRRTALWTGAAILVCLAAPAAHMMSPALAQTVATDDLHKAATTKDKKVDIEADHMEVLDDQKKAIFTGKVDAKRSDVTLHTDKLVVDYVKADNTDSNTKADTKTDASAKTDAGTKTDAATKSDSGSKTEVTFLEATGHVVIITAKQRITGEKARMDVKANKLVVTGNVVVTQDKTIMKGKELHVDLKTNHSELTGGRVKGSFVPQGQ